MRNFQKRQDSSVLNFRSLVTVLKREVAITWALCRNNIPGNLAGFLGGFIPRVFIRPVPFLTVAVAFMRVILMCIVWDYLIDIANTTTSVEEDKVNKPHRPIPSGLITVRQSQWRWYISWCIAPFIVFGIYGAWAAFYIVVWQGWVTVFYVWPAYRHWMMKNLMTTGATLILLRLLNAILRDVEQWTMSPEPDVIVSVWTMATIHLQDFRDIDGDRNTHVVTLPIMLSPEGQIKLRYSTACVLVASEFLSIFWIWTRAAYASALLSSLFFHLSSLVLVFYTVTSRSKHQNRIMYRWWMTTGFCIISHVFYLSLL